MQTPRRQLMTKALRRLGGEETDVVIRVTFAAFQVPYRGNRLAAARA
jgi:hypothetical protein